MSTADTRIHEGRMCGSDGTSLRYITCGSGYPVVVSTPIGLHLDFWRPLFSTQSAQNFRFIALQSRTLWGSEPSPTQAGDTLERHAQDIAELVALEGLKNYAALGYCGGSAPLVAALSRVSALPESIMLVSTLFRRDRQEQIVQRILNKFTSSPRPSAYRMILSVAFQIAVPQFQMAAEAEICTERNLPSYLRQLHSLYSYDFPLDFPNECRLNISYCSGDIESIRSSSTEYFNNLNKSNSSIRIIDNADHFYLFNDPENAIRTVMDALGSHAGILYER